MFFKLVFTNKYICYSKKTTNTSISSILKIKEKEIHTSPRLMPKGFIPTYATIKINTFASFKNEE